jgi:hypothetical protein
MVNGKYPKPILVSVPYGDSEELLRAPCVKCIRVTATKVSVPYGDSEELLLLSLRS